jgi:hypothetical protein
MARVGPDAWRASKIDHEGHDFDDQNQEPERRFFQCASDLHALRLSM